MTDWVLTKGLQNLRDQMNAAFPDRDKTSDGTIGDAAHAAGISGHDPDDVPNSHAEWNGDPDSTPEVRAWDMDSDLRSPGVTAQQVVDHIRGLPGVSSVLRYMIYNRKIYKASNGWVPEAYYGLSPHTEHIHFSGAYSQAADNNTTFDYRLEDLVAISDDDVRKIWMTDGIIAAPDWAAKSGNQYWSPATYLQNQQAALAKVQLAIAGLPQDVLEKLADSTVSDQDVANSLRAVLGNRAPAIGRLLAD